MKKVSTILLTAVTVVLAVRSYGFTVYIPPGNIVLNGNFNMAYTNWSGNIPGWLPYNWPSIPNNGAALAKDIYQILPTSPGQEYSLSFYTAADLYWSPSVNVTVALDSDTLASFATPPYTYDPFVERYEQMHWQQLTYSFIASSSTTKLEFIDTSTYDFGLAAVSVIAVPEPTTITLMAIAGTMMMIVRTRRR